RLVGVSVDAAGAPAMRLALQTREQHIRREKATSNICTAQVLLAVMAGMYAVWHGPEGLTRIAKRVRLLARLAGDAAARLGFTLRHQGFFDTITLEAGARADALMAAALTHGFNLRRVDAGGVAIAMDETVTRDDLTRLLGALAEAAGKTAPALDALMLAGDLPEALRRTSSFLTASVFNSHHSEHGMLRYMKSLEDKDVALNRSMIPLGSCTMKLNATAEMIPVTFPGFGNIHPFAPVDQAAGYITMIRRLEAWLARITGFAAVSLQPNAGSQGEYAGLLAIRAWHLSRGDADRTICLIPSSAHGTNPASAVMAGMQVVVVGCDRDGNVDIADLKAKLD
ncbi:MAG: glycine dehydrogenase (aminomethyl-transferring), partial [Acetobacteraceae bacterium]|nr:glycine dehydrogenase (aminomethyl-transferring) [Acetobacteraceae bacterium]